MAARKTKLPPPMPMRWHEADWLWLAEVAKSIGLSRSDFVRRSALAAASAVTSGMTSYSVAVTNVTPQNTHPNQFRSPIAKQGGVEVGGGEEPNHVSTGGDHVATLGQRWADRGGRPTNGAMHEANQPNALRS